MTQKPLNLVLLALALALAALFAFFWLSPEQSFKRALERQGSAVTGSPLHVERVAWSKDNGVFLVTGLALANPPGFSQGDILTAPVVEVAVDPTTLDQEVVHVVRVTVSGPRIRYESGTSGSNFEALERRIKEQPASAGGKRFVIDQLAVRDAKVQLAPAAPTTGAGNETDLLGLRDEDLGSDKGGITAAELAQRLAQEIGQRLRLTVGIENLKSGIKNLFGQ
jgi:uncharacterized protein involved in outer membrane biogenesis